MLRNEVSRHPRVCIPVSAVGGRLSEGKCFSPSPVCILPGWTYTGVHMDRQTPQPVPSATELVTGNGVENLESEENKERRNGGGRKRRKTGHAKAPKRITKF